ncbi:formyltransferase family protein [Sulfurimonas sp.]
MNVAILTSAGQWFISYAEELKNKINDSKLFFDHKDIDSSFDVVFILSYHKIIEEKYLKQHKYNIVVHASALPKGKGWAPMFWQILENKNKIPFTMFEASLGIDDGDIYMRKILELDGLELNKELREKQGKFIIYMCLEFLIDFDKYKIAKKQVGDATIYLKRTYKDSELDINKTINEQFNLLRIIDNDDYPAFFYKSNKKYILKIEKADNEDR